MSSKEENVGLIGLGLMGTALAGRLLRAGFSAHGYDVDAAKSERLRGMGGTAAASIAEVTARCDRMLLAVFDTDQVETVIEGPDGILCAIADRGVQRLVLNTSTCDADRVAALARRVARRGVTLLETPLSGTSDQVARGEAVCFVSGEPATPAPAEDIFAAICRKHFFMGAPGNASKTKLAVNLILGLNRAALAEGLVFAERVGLPLDTFLDVARESAAYSQVMDVKGKKMINADFSPHARVKQSLKDFSLMLGTAESVGQSLPFATIYANLLRGCIDHGEADWDNSAIIEEIRRRRAEAPGLTPAAGGGEQERPANPP